MRTAIEIAESVRRGDLKAVEALEESLAGIEARNPALNAFVHVDADLARRAAERVDRLVADGHDPGPLAGVPFGVKDLEDCAGMPTAKGSLLYKGRPPVEADSVHVARMRAAGAVPVGKTATPEFGCTCYTSTTAFGTTRNPWNLERTPGGSSGGSAAAVAGGLVPLSTASDGGGSTRIPAAFSGLYGFKPSFGRIPLTEPPGSETAVVGVVTTTVADAARHLDVTAGPHSRDKASLPAWDGSYEQVIETPAVAGLRAVWSADMGFGVTQADVADVAFAAAEALVGAAGLELVERPFNPPRNPMRTWLAATAVDPNLSIEAGMFPERADDVDPINRRALEITADRTVPWYAGVMKKRTELEHYVADFFDEVDVLLTPTTAVPAFAAEGPLPFTIDGQDARESGPTPYTMLFNMTWNPAASVPAGLAADGLPVGLQIVVPRHRDDLALRLSRIFEQARPWPRLAPFAGE